MNNLYSRLWRRLIGGLFLLWGVASQAAPVLVTLDTHLLAGSHARLAFDLVDGGPAANSLQISAFASDGVLGASSAEGGVSGQLPGQLSLNDSAFFNEYVQELEFGNWLSFVFDSSDLGNGGGFLPDGFSLFVLDAQGQPLLSTSDPTGAHASLLYSLGEVQGLQLYQSDLLTISAQAQPPNTVAEPASWGLLWIAGLALLLARPGRLPGLPGRLLLLGALLGGQAAWAADLTPQLSISKSALVLNRSTNTFDTLVTLRNQGSDPLSGPLQLTIESIAPANVALYNSTGRNAQSKDYVLVPLKQGLLAAGASASVPVKLINTGRAVTQLQFSVHGTRLDTAHASTLQVNAFYADGAQGEQKGASVGAGFTVKIDGYGRGTTDENGRLSILVPSSAKTVAVSQSPNAAGSAQLSGLQAGQNASVDVLVGDGGEVYAEGLLRFEQVQQLLLARNAARVSLRFMRDEQALRLGALNFVQLSNVLGQSSNLSPLFSIQPDGSVSAAPAAFYQALAGLNGRATLTVDGEDVDGQAVNGKVSFYLADFKTRVQLQAPPSKPGLNLAGVRIVASVLNTDVLVRAESDANGLVTLPDLPGGNISLESITTADGLSYTGQGTAVLNKHSLVRLTLRGPSDILNNVPAISVHPLPPGMGLGAAQPSLMAAGAISERAVFTPAELAERQAYANRLAGAHAKQAANSANSAKALSAATSSSVTINVSAGAQNAQIEQSAQLKLPKGTKKALLSYTVATAEYPTYVLAQSVYNDVWSLSVLASSGSSLFDITRQVNSQLTQEPVWLANGSTGLIKKEFDVSALTASADATLILRATAVNIGDGILPTSVSAKLDSAQQLTIGDITPDAVNSQNDGSYYSVPRSGAGNSHQRTFTVQVTKPSGSTLTFANVKLLDSASANLMEVLADTAPGAAGVTVEAEDDSSARLKIRTTVQNPVSTIAGTPPHTRDIGYRFRIKGKDSEGVEISDEKDLSGKRSLWRMPDVIGRYGSRDTGGDDWAARGTYNWMAANSGLLREVNDVSGEHGIDLGHQTHARGTDIDMFHFYLFPGVTTAPGQGMANFNRLRADVVAAFATLVTPPAQPPAAAVQARARVQAWIAGTRTGLTNLAAPAAVSAVIHCSGPAANGLPAGWCRTLLTQATATMTTPQPGGPALVRTLDFGNGAYANAKMLNNNVHNDHIHVTLIPGQIGE